VLSMSGGLEAPAWLAFHPGGAPLEKIVSEDSVWEAPEGTEAYWYGYEVVTGDYNGDGYPDMALSLGKDGKAHVLLGGAEPDFDSDIQYAFIADDAACAPGIIATLNMNGDAFDDLAA